MQFREPTFEAMVRAIVYQLLSGRVASIIYGRFEALVKGKVTPAVILEAAVEDMRACGLSGQKAAYIRDLLQCAEDASTLKSISVCLLVPPTMEGSP